MKRPREEGSSSSDEPSSCSDDGDAVPLPVSEAHPLGVRPWGDLLTLGEVEDEAQGAGNGQAPSKPSVRDVLRRRAAGMGSFALLPDALILTVLAEVAGSPDGASGLARLASTSTVMYAYCSNDDLWRPLALAALDRRPGAMRFAGTWKETYRRTGEEATKSHGGCGDCDRPPRRISSSVYSDYLYQSWFCARLQLPVAWLAKESVPRRSGVSLTPAAFASGYGRRNAPVILTDVVTSWPAFREDSPRRWTRAYLSKLSSFHVGGYEMAPQAYWDYCDRLAWREEMPLYLFDKRFGEKLPSLLEDFVVPPQFGEDLFALLGKGQGEGEGEGEGGRPDHRWLIAGPARSGSSFHKDPNGTSAWNAVISGRKKWLLFPPHVCPPGVHASEDGSHVASPVSLVEWFVNFYAEASRTPGCHECVVEAGEVIFVPSGWWHLVINLTDDCIALTQNFASKENVGRVMRSIRDPELVSGLPQGGGLRESLHGRFEAALRRAGIIDAPRGSESKEPAANGHHAGVLAKTFIKHAEARGEGGGGDDTKEKDPTAEAGGFKFNFFSS